MEEKLINDIEVFKMAMQSYHLDKPKLGLEFEDSLSDEIRQFWQEMDKSILKLIWEINKEEKK